MIDEERKAHKRAYDKAAEALCSHIEACPDCTMSAVRCDEGLELAEGEDAAWRMYRRMRP